MHRRRPPVRRLPFAAVLPQRRLPAAVLVLAFHAAMAAAAPAQTSPAAPPAYQSPYRLALDFSDQELLADLAGQRGDPRFSSQVPFAQWYSPATKAAYGAWGPPARHYPAPVLKRRDADFLRQRVLAVAARYVGYSYQHHHLPDWHPPADWPAKPVESAPGKGVDCSNFTSFVYNLALGIVPTSECESQSKLTAVPGPGPGRTSPVRRIELPDDRGRLSDVLQPADLLFVRGENTETVTHVVLWLGRCGVLADGSPAEHPLVIDSHGSGARDQQGGDIPAGVYLRPVRPGYWYARRATHALRIIPD